MPLVVVHRGVAAVVVGLIKRTGGITMERWRMVRIVRRWRRRRHVMLPIEIILFVQCHGIKKKPRVKKVRVKEKEKKERGAYFFFLELMATTFGVLIQASIFSSPVCEAIYTFTVICFSA
jgi:hypothetical protein